MATLLEKIAAKKAAAAIAAKDATVSINVTTPHVDQPKKEEPVCTQEQQPSVSSPVPQEKPVASLPSNKPLTFAEKMALKKQEALDKLNGQAQSKPSVAETKPAVLPQSSVTVLTATKQKEETVSTAQEAQDETAQAYADIKAKIKALADTPEMQLPDAMKDLKASLMQNPQACYLLLPREIGEMVIALCIIKREAADAAEDTKKAKGEKKTKTSASSKTLTAQEIEDAFSSIQL